MTPSFEQSFESHAVYHPYTVPFLPCMFSSLLTPRLPALAVHSISPSSLLNITAAPVPGGRSSHVGLAQPQLCHATHSHSVRVYDELFSSWLLPPPSTALRSHGGKQIFTK